MKAFILIASLVSCALFAQSQTAFLHTKSNPTGTITNTGADTSTYSLPGSYETLAIQPNVVRTSGTLAGTVIFQFSVNGSGWIAPAGDTLTLSNAATSAPTVWHFLKPDWLYCRIITTGSGTMVATTAHTFIAKKASF